MGLQWRKSFSSCPGHGVVLGQRMKQPCGRSCCSPGGSEGCEINLRNQSGVFFFLTNVRTKNQMSRPGKWPCGGRGLRAVQNHCEFASGAGGESAAPWLPWVGFKLSFLRNWLWGGCGAALARGILVPSPHRVPPGPCLSCLGSGAALWVNMDLV